MEATREEANRRTAVKLLAVPCLMFAFGYALVPLYSVFCEITGLNGKTGRLSAAEAAQVQVDLNRSVTVEFVTSVNAGMPWEFRPPARKITVHPGVATTVEFEATNYAQFPVTGIAVPSVAPNEAARYFNKTECFCFHPAITGTGRIPQDASQVRGRSQAPAKSRGIDPRVHFFRIDGDGRSRGRQSAVTGILRHPPTPFQLQRLLSWLKHTPITTSRNRVRGR